MDKQHKRYLVTAALPYANGPVHIGHLAGCYLPADIYVRYQRAQKRDIKFICGSDEHGVPITIRAMKEGVSPQQVVDRYHEMIKDSFAKLNISFDIYSRTSNQVHHETASAFFKKMYDDGLFEEKDSEQFFDEKASTFLADRYITGTCPVCGNEGAYGDQCEKCGSSLSPEQLINPRSALSDAVPVKKQTKHWYFPLQNYEPWLKQWILEEHKEWKNNVYGQCKSWLDQGLQSRAMTRDSNWGVKVPLPDEVLYSSPVGGGREGAGKVLYVWFDAPIGYLSATKELTDQWADYWCDKDSKLVHFIGKDNIVFHCIIFPAMLKAHGGFIVPENVPANEFLNLEGQKISTSRNWAVWVHEFVNEFPGCEDMLRYYLTTILPETKDSEFTWKGFQDAVNSELVAIFANFFNRTFVLMHKLTVGKVPKFHNDIADDIDKQLMADIKAAKGKIENLIEEYKFRDALFEVIDLSRKGNKYLQEKEPWKKASSDKTQVVSEENRQKVDNCIHLCLQLCANLAIYINPFLPGTAKKMCHMMKVVDRVLEWKNAGSLKLLSVGYSLRPPELLFRKIDDAEVITQIEKLKKGMEEQHAASSSQSAVGSEQSAVGSQQSEVGTQQSTIGNQQAETSNTPSGKRAEIQYDDFAKLDLRIGTITSAEKVQKADKLLKLEVDLGFEKRTILSGIAQHFSPESLVNKQVIVVANLAPRKMRGIESQGMILTAEQPDGKLILVNPDDVTVNGSTVR